MAERDLNSRPKQREVMSQSPHLTIVGQPQLSLLMCHDCLDGDDLPLTRDFLSLMLGIRRSGVTEALHALEGVQIVKPVRGHILLRDRTRLEKIAGGCYSVPEAEYAKLIG